MTLVALAGRQRGVELDEAGLDIESFEVSVKPEFKEYLKDKVGQNIGFAVGTVMRDITLLGEIKATTGVMALTFTAAATLANDVDYFGAGSEDPFLDEATISQGREAWKRLSAKFSSYANIAA